MISSAKAIRDVWEGKKDIEIGSKVTFSFKLTAKAGIDAETRSDFNKILEGYESNRYGRLDVGGVEMSDITKSVILRKHWDDGINSGWEVVGVAHGEHLVKDPALLSVTEHVSMKLYKKYELPRFPENR